MGCDVIRRRDAIRAGLLGAMAGPMAMAIAAPPSPREVRAFRLAETAGLRRFGYPVQAVVPDAEGGRNFRLVRDGRPIAAQFREVEALGGGGREVALDFIASPGPLESSRYEVEFGSRVEPGPEPSAGVKLERRDGRSFVSQGSSMTFEVADDLGGLLRGAGSSRLGYLRETSRGLSVLGPRGEVGRVGGGGPAVACRVVREGPMAVALRFATDSASLVVDLTFPHSKTWARADVMLDDPDGRVHGLEVDLNLLVEGSPTIVDFGAGSTIYGRIDAGRSMTLEAGRADGEAREPVGWHVWQGEAGDPRNIHARSSVEFPRPAEGWAHVMDARRCSALAVADFGRRGARDALRVDGDGHVLLSRLFPAAKGVPNTSPKTFTFWIHCVPMPVQIGAATSPQAILAPLRVEWDRPPKGRP